MTTLNRWLSPLVVPLMTVLSATALAAPPAGSRLSFVSCPAVRDTRTVPCWTSEYQGDTYYLTIQSDVSAQVQPPMLGHKVLVEGVVSDKPAICGGVVLEQVRLSVMPELDANCNTMLPVDDRYPIDFNPRPPGPSSGRLAFDPAPGAVATPPPPPTGEQQVPLYFDFDKGVSFRHPDALVNLVSLAGKINAGKLRVTGVRGAHRLSNGTLLQESDGIGQRRAEEVANLLQGAGLKLDTQIDWIDGVAEADGVDDWQSRRVTVVLTPAAGASGPELAISYSDPSLPTHTIYRPQDLQGSYPVVLWGNGSCVNSNYGYREFLTQIASHGFIVLAVGPYRDSLPPRQQRPADPAAWPEFETQSQQLLDGLDWIAAEAARSGSDWQGHVDSTHVAVMGHSCGGMQAMSASTDPRVTTTVILNSGIFPDGDQYNARFGLMRSQLQALHAPIAYFIGGETDIAYVNAEQDWQDLQRGNIAALNANLDVGHGATYALPQGGPFAAGPLAWLQWQLKDDAAASALLTAKPCGLCTHGQWRVRLHQLP